MLGVFRPLLSIFRPCAVVHPGSLDPRGEPWDHWRDEKGLRKPLLRASIATVLVGVAVKKLAWKKRAKIFMLTSSYCLLFVFSVAFAQSIGEDPGGWVDPGVPYQDVVFSGYPPTESGCRSYCAELADIYVDRCNADPKNIGTGATCAQEKISYSGSCNAWCSDSFN